MPAPALAPRADLRALPRRLDPIWTISALAFVALGLFSPADGARAVVFVTSAFEDIGLFLLASVAIAAAATAANADGVVARGFERAPPGVAILAAALIGALSPFCSCGVAPLIAALARMGAPLPAIMAFWLASPLMDPSMFALTVGAVGLEFAVAKTLSAVAVGLIGGYGAAAMMGFGLIAPTPFRARAAPGACGAGASCDRAKTVLWRFWREPERVRVFWRDARESRRFSSQNGSPSPSSSRA